MSNSLDRTPIVQSQTTTIPLDLEHMYEMGTNFPVVSLFAT